MPKPKAPSQMTQVLTLLGTISEDIVVIKKDIVELKADMVEVKADVKAIKETPTVKRELALQN